MSSEYTQRLRSNSRQRQILKCVLARAIFLVVSRASVTRVEWYLNCAYLLPRSAAAINTRTTSSTHFIADAALGESSSDVCVIGYM